MKKFFVYTFLLNSIISYSQGSLVLIGGGGESNGGWSDAPYTWALDESQNRKVAVFYYNSSPLGLQSILWIWVLPILPNLTLTILL